ncbi:MAG: hypothetical protein ACI9LG_001910 [Moritella dasanensis]|jgi:hypothetical protein
MSKLILIIPRYRYDSLNHAIVLDYCTDFLNMFYEI